MANIFRAKHLVSRTGTFSHEVTAPNIVYNTGDQIISGLKDFTTRPTVNTVPVLLSGEAADGLDVLVKNDDSITLRKGQPVYIYGANGAVILVRAASNSGDSTSSKTLGLLSQDLAPNDQGYVITEGGLDGVDTSLAGSVGDAIWLGPTGNLIFGLANKPYAPDHLVYLGIVERKHQNVGKIYVKIQNGFELEELHNVNINHRYALSDNDVIRYDAASGLWFNQSLNTGIFQNQINSLSGAAVLRYGYQTIDGTKVFRDNVYINNLYVTGTETILNTTSNNIASPYLLLNLTGGLTDGGIFFVTGSGLTGINDTGVIFGFDNITKSWHFGQGTRLTDISTLDEVMGYHDLSGYSGFANQTFSTIINLANTGSTLTSNINLLSGTFNTTGWNLFTGVNNVATNLRSTGDTLIARDNSMSGSFNTTGWNLFTGVNNVATNLRTTGDTLIALTTSMSGTFNTTGLNLSDRINSLSGAAVLIYNNQNIGGNKTFTGITTFSGNIGVSGTGIFNAIDFNSIDNLYLSGIDVTITGSFVNIFNDVFISGNRVLTGVENLNIVFTTGNQTISGNKTFTNNIIYPVSPRTSGTNFTPNADIYTFFDYVLTGNSTLNEPTNMSNGESITIFLNQDASGSRTMSFNSAYLFSNGITPSLNFVPSGVDIMQVIRVNNRYFTTFASNY